MNFRGSKVARISITHWVTRSDLVQAAGELVSEGQELWDASPKHVRALIEARVRNQLFARGALWPNKAHQLSPRTMELAGELVANHYPDLEAIE